MTILRDVGIGAPPRRKAAQRKTTRRRPDAIFGAPGAEGRPFEVARRQAVRRARRAEERAPGTTLPVRRLPVLARPTERQAKAIVREQTRALAGVPATARAQALRTGDVETRRQLAQTRRAQEELARSRRVRQGLAVVRADPKAAGVDAKTLEALRVLAGRGRIPSSVRGTLASIGAGVDREAAKGRAVARPGRDGRTRLLGVATIDAAKVGRRIGAHLATGHGAGVAAGPLRNAATDALHLPYDAVRSLYEIGAAGVEAAQTLPGVPGRGSTERGKRIVGALDEGALGRLLIHGDPKGAVKALEEHPLYSALEVLGAYGAAGRVAGAGVRGAGGAARVLPKGGGRTGEALRRLGSTRRDSLVVVPGSNLKVSRSYSKNLLTALGQRSREKGLRKQGLDPNLARPGILPGRGQDRLIRRAVDEAASTFQNVARGDREGMRVNAAQGRPQRAGAPRATRESRQAENRQRVLRALEAVGAVTRRRGEGYDQLAARLGGTRLAALAKQHGVPLRVSRVTRARAGAKGAVRGAVDRRVPTKVAVTVPFTAKRVAHYLRPERDLVVAAVEKRLGAEGNFREKLRREVDRLEDAYRTEHRDMSLAERRNNRGQVGAMRAMLSDLEAGGKKGARAQKAVTGLFEGAERYGRASRRITAELVKHKLLDPDQAAAAVLRPFAVAELGARYAEDTVTPEGDAPYQAAKAKEAAARKAERDARRAHAKARQERARLSGASSVRRGQRRVAVAGRPGELAGGTRAQRVLAYIKAAEEKGTTRMAGREASDAKALARAETAVGQTRKARTAAQRAARQATRERKATVAGRTSSGLVVGPEGRRLTTAAIEAAYRREFGEDAPLPGFVTHRPDAQGAAAFFVNWFGRSGRKTADTFSRTGEATRRGGHGFDEAAAVESLVHAQGVLSAAQNWDRFVGGFGQRRPDGRMFTWDEAEQFARGKKEAVNAEIPGEVELQPVRVAPSRYGDQRLEDIAQLGGSGMADEPRGVLSERLTEMLQAPDSKDRQARNVVLVPKVAVDRFTLHQTPTLFSHTRAAQGLTNIFRNTVLPTSTKWLTGNVAEAVLRSLVAGVTPLDVIQGRRVVRDMLERDAELGKLFQTRTQSGLFYGSAGQLSIRRDRTALEGTSVEFLSRGGGVVRQAPVVKQLIDGYQAYARAVFGINGWAEKQFQAGVIGKEVRREIQEMTGSWTKAVRFQRAAVEDVLQGLTKTENQVRFARAIDEVLGQYSRFGPVTRRITQNIAPFLPWYLNAARFVYWTLPGKHPVKTAVLASVEREFDKEFERDASQLPPGDLGAAIRRPDGGLVTVARYGPFGAFTAFGRNLEHPEAAGDPLFPQFMSLWQILNGRNFANRDLQTSSGEAPSGSARVGLAAYAAMESVFPFMQMGRRLQEKGETALDDSKVWSPKTKPGTSYGRSAAERVFSPVSPIYLQGPTGGGGAAVTPAQQNALRRALRRGQAVQASQTRSDAQIRRALRRARALAR